MPDEDIWSWSTTAAANGTADTGISWPEGQTRASVNNSARAMMAAHAKNRNLLSGNIVTTGTASAQRFLSGINYTVIPTGLQAVLKIGTGLTSVEGTVTTLNMDSIGDIPVKNQRGESVEEGLVAGTYAHFIYDGTNWVWLEAEFLTIINNIIEETVTTVTDTIATTIVNQTIINTIETGPVALVDFTDLDSTQYARYSVVVTDLIPENEYVGFMLSVSTDNGVTFPIDIADYRAVETFMSAARIASSGLPYMFASQASRAHQPLSWALYASQPLYPAQIMLDLFNFKPDVRPAFYFNSGTFDQTIEGIGIETGWGYVLRTGCNAIRLWPTAGNIKSATITLYGFH